MWFEPVAAYDNAKLSQAMILSGYWTSRGDVVDIGLQSLRWLVEQQTAERRAFRADRQQWLLDPRRRARPFRSATSGSPRHDCRLRGSVRADSGCELAPGCAPLLSTGFSIATISVSHSTTASTGGCRDALHQDRVNQNQGAESTLAFHLSRAEMTRAEAVLYSETQRLARI